MTYDEIKKLDKAVLKFSAEWCSPCRSLSPIFNDVASKYPEHKVCLIDVDKYPEIAQKFGIKGIPTIMKIKEGSVTLQMSGALPATEIEKFFNEV